VPLRLLEAVHVRVVCDGCGNETAEVCGKHESPPAARAMAAAKFRNFGWHQDLPSRRDRAQPVDDGRWYCPVCARRTHP